MIPLLADNLVRVADISGWRCPGGRPGHPVKAAATILAAIDADNTPLRPPLGNDAADAISASPGNARAELATWKSATRGTDFDHCASSQRLQQPKPPKILIHKS